jgi:hypothetical protein
MWAQRAGRGQARPRRRRALVAAATLAALATGCSLIGGGSGSDPEPAVEAFAAAWADGDISAMAALAASGGRDADLAIRQFQTALEVDGSQIEVAAVERDGDAAVATLAVTHDVAGLGEWSYRTDVPLENEDGVWAVAWAPTVLHPALGEGRTVRRSRRPGVRAPILARAGQRLAVGNADTRVPTIAPATVGEVATADAEAGAPSDSADTVGVSGLERAYDEQLAGRSSGAVQLLSADGSVVEDLATFDPVPAEPLTTTLDIAVQRAADDAIAASPLPVALVVVDSDTGAVLAVANNPPGFDRAFLGEYPPGSTFKVITATAMLEDGVRPEDRLPCPAETRPGDSRPFANAFGKDGGIVTFTEAFAVSCNTTFVDEGFRLGGDALQTQAERFGFNGSFNPGIPAVVGKFPLPETDTELAASAIGQGRVSVSPLHMASVAAAARTGTWRAPYLVEPTPDLDQDLGSDIASDLTSFMRAVVEDEDGTATNVAVDGHDVGGKTGTAEFGDEDPPETHAWFIGFADHLSFAVVVEGGGVGGPVAGPIARSFIENLPPPFESAAG